MKEYLIIAGTWEQGCLGHLKDGEEEKAKSHYSILRKDSSPKSQALPPGSIF